MKNTFNKYAIANLIYKSVVGLLTDEDKNMLDSWLSKKENKFLYKEIINKNNIQNKIELHNKIDSDKIFRRLESKILQEEREYRIPIYKSPLVKYAAAACVLLFVSLIIFINKKDSLISLEPMPIVASHNIEIGTNRAILTLEDGSDIVLEKGESYSGQNIESNGEEIIYKTTDKLEGEVAFNYLTTPRGGQYFVKLSDGTKVWLNSESKIKYPVSFIQGESREVELLYGEAYFDVTPSSENSGFNFKVTHASQEIIVLGTEFNIKAYKDEDYIFTTLVEGKIALTIDKDQEILAPNEQLILNLSNRSRVIKSEIDIFPEIAWKKGLFNFKDKSLLEIMDVLSRWYDVDFVFENKALEEVRFKGVLNKNQNIEEILNLIKNTNYISDYLIEDTKIILKN
jgi:transmembrane sensor